MGVFGTRLIPVALTALAGVTIAAPAALSAEAGDIRLSVKEVSSTPDPFVVEAGVRVRCPKGQTVEVVVTVIQKVDQYYEATEITVTEVEGQGTATARCTGSKQALTVEVVNADPGVFEPGRKAKVLSSATSGDAKAQFQAKLVIT